MRRYEAVVLAAALALTTTGCGGPTGASPAASGATTSPGISLAASSPRGTPRPPRATQRTSSAKPRPTVKPRGTVYVIKTGDTLYGIAVRFKVTLAALLAANPTIKNSNQIAIGQRIVIPTR